jgi:hypothetical protein
VKFLKKLKGYKFPVTDLIPTKLFQSGDLDAALTDTLQKLIESGISKYRVLQRNG